MRKKVFIVCSGFLLAMSCVCGQCPNKDSLWQKLFLFRTSSPLTPKDELPILLDYARKLQNCPNKYDSTHALLLRRIGALNYKMGNYVNAVQYFKQSISIISANASKPSVNVKELIGAYWWLSVFYDSLNRVSDKMDALDSSAAIAMRLKAVDLACLSALYKRTEYFFEIGDYNRCIEYAVMCRKLAQQYSTFETGYAFSSLHWQVNALLELKQYSAAQDLLLAQVAENKKTGFTKNLGTLYEQLGEVAVKNGHYDTAFSYFSHALAYERKQSRFNYRTILENIGDYIFFGHEKNYDKAMWYYQRALKYTEKNFVPDKDDSVVSLSVCRDIANLFAYKEQYDSALNYFKMAFGFIRPGADERDILSISLDAYSRQKRINYLSGLLIDFASAYQKRYKARGELNDYHNAVRIYKIADQFLDRIKATQFDLQSKLFWRADSKKLYEQAIEACYLKGNIDDAFYFFEKGRAVLLNDQLNSQRWEGERDILEQTQLKKGIVQLERNLNQLNRSSLQYNELQNELFDKKQKLDGLEKAIEVNNPFYYQNFIDPGSITIKDVKEKILKDHDALLEIFSGDSAVYILGITHKSNYLLKANKSRFVSLSIEYLTYLSDQVMINRDVGHFVDVAHQLYQLLFQSISIPDGRIVVSPDEQYFPFEALVTSNDKQHIKYFIDGHAVSYTYSARYLLNNFGSTTGKDVKTFLGVAPVHYAANERLAPLTGSDGSLQKIGSYLRSKSNLIGADASRRNFLRDYYRFRVIQLYTHATDNGLNEEPMIWLADSALFLSDLVYEDKPATQLVVLSACETAKGKLYRGEGVFSFNRGFAAMGIPACISNLWKIDNETTYKITELFYKQISQGVPTDVALQQAKLEFINTATKENRLPYYWSAAILVGANDTIQLNNGTSWKVILLIIVIATVCMVIGYKTFIKGRPSKKVTPHA
jgi:CHAT domain-containing protein